MIDLHTADLSISSYADALAWIEASVETQRVEFKEALPSKLDSIVDTCCAFANAYGGVIVVGFVDPDRTTRPLVPTSLALDVSDKALLRVDSTIIDLVRPGIRFEIARFPASLSMPERPQFAVIRIPASPVKPHEVLPSHVFFVRRDRRNDRLGLPEIEAMLAARVGGVASRDRWDRVAPYSSVMFGQPMIDVAGAHIGISLSPVDAHLAGFEHGRDDDEFVMDLMRTIAVVQELAFLPEENGIFMSEGSTEAAARGKAPFAAVITGTGEFFARLRIGHRTQFSQDVDDLANVLAISYNLVARYYRRKRFGPLARMQVVIANTSTAQRLVSVLPEVHALGKEIDLSTTFPHAVGRFVERLWRSAGSNPTSAAIETLLTDVWEMSFRSQPSPRPWYADKMS